MSQTELILSHLKNHPSITPLEAWHLYGCLRLGARIYDLRKKGHAIETMLIHHGKKQYAHYFITKKKRRKHHA